METHNCKTTLLREITLHIIMDISYLRTHLIKLSPTLSAVFGMYICP